MAFEHWILTPSWHRGLASSTKRTAWLDAAAQVGARSVTVQWLQHQVGTDREPIAPDHAMEPAIAGLLDEAAARGLQVWLGLWFGKSLMFDLWEAGPPPHPEPWDRAGLVRPDSWLLAGAGCLRIAPWAVQRFAGHPAWAGWFWTPEFQPGRASVDVPLAGNLLGDLCDRTSAQVQQLRHLGGPEQGARSRGA